LGAGAFLPAPCPGVQELSELIAPQILEAHLKLAELKIMAADSVPLSRCINVENRFSRGALQRAREVRRCAQRK
jgi:hypothetical protein